MAIDGDIVVVSGLPRSGTSMMMRMICAGGIPALMDQARVPDPDNPHGYFEFEAVKRTREDPSWVSQAPGKVVKLVHLLLPDLPEGRRYRVVLMRRDLDEVLASQQTMLARQGRTGARMPPDALKRVFAAQLDAVTRWMDERPWFSRLEVRYDRVVADPAAEASRVAACLGVPQAAGAMAAAVDPSLYRNRR
jgi:hypothetical protein